MQMGAVQIRDGKSYFLAGNRLYTFHLSRAAVEALDIDGRVSLRQALSFTIDSDAMLYLATVRAVYKLDLSGAFIGQWLPTNEMQYDAAFFDHEGSIYFWHDASRRFRVYDYEGNHQFDFGVLQDTPDYICSPASVRRAADGTILVADSRMCRICIFDGDGRSFGRIKYEFFLSDRADLRWPLNACFDWFTGSAEPTVRNPGPTYFIPGATYYWRIRGMNSRGVWSAWSETWSFTYHGPGRVTRLSWTEVEGGLRLDWEHPEDGVPVDHYRIYASNEKGFIPADEPFAMFNGRRLVTYPGTFCSSSRDPNYVVGNSSARETQDIKLYHRVIAVDRDGKVMSYPSCKSENSVAS